MKKRLLLLPLLAGMVLSGCDFDLGPIHIHDANQQGQDQQGKVVSVTVSGAPASVTSGTTFQLTADVVVENNASKEVTWSTSNASVATVSESGLVTPVGSGSVTITATSVADTSKSGSVTFSVSESTKPAIVSVTIKGASSEANAGSTMNLTAEVIVQGSASKSVTWKTSDASVATVSSSGVVKFLKEGVVTITATSSLDSTKSDSVTITVKEGKWSDADKAMMQEYLGIVVPYFSGSFVWTDEYFEDYACLTAESNVSADYNSAVAGFEAAGWYIEDYGDEVYAILETADFQYLADIYEYGGIVSVDVYAYEIIKAWPAEDIAAALKEAGIEVSLPVFETEEAVQFTFDVERDEETGEALYLDICAYPDDEKSELTHLDYLELFDDSFSKEEDTYGDYLVIPQDKSCMIYVMSLVDYDYEVVPGFEVVVTPYVADYSIKASVDSEFLVTGEKATISVEKIGADVPEEAVISFSSSDETVATVSAAGVVTAVKEGKVVISASYEGYVSSVTLYVKDSIATAFTEAQLDMFKNIHDVEGLAVPFNAHFIDVSYDLEDKVVEVRGDEVGVEAAVAYRQQLLDAGWVDLLEEQGAYEFYLALLQAFGMDATIDDVVAMMVIDGIPFEKEVKVSESKSYFISADLYLDVESEEDEEGALCVDVYDVYMYSYAEAKVVADEYLALFEIESEAGFPEGEISGSHYYVELDDEDGYVALAAYDTTATLEDLKTALEASGFVLEEANDEINGNYLVGTSSDGLLDVVVMIYGDDAEIMVGPHVEESNGVTIDFAEVTAADEVTMGAFTFVTDKAKGQSAPAYNESKKELRLYANNTITFTSEETMTSIFFDANTCGESKATGSFVSASVGTVSAVEGGFLWEGEANEVTLTVSASGQIHINSIDINGGGEGGGSSLGDLTSWPASQIAACLEGGTENLPLAAEGTSFTFTESEEYYYDCYVDVYGGDADAYLESLEKAGYVITDYTVDYGCMSAVTPDGTLTIDLYEDEGFYTLDIYASTPSESYTSWSEIGVASYFPGFSGTIPAATGTSFEVAAEEGYVQIMVEGGDVDAYVEALAKAGYDVDDEYSIYGMYFALSSDGSLEIDVMDYDEGAVYIQIYWAEE